MLSDTQIRSLKIEDGKRHADRDGLVLELRPSFSQTSAPIAKSAKMSDNSTKKTHQGYAHRVSSNRWVTFFKP